MNANFMKTKKKQRIAWNGMEWNEKDVCGCETTVTTPTDRKSES